MGERLRSSASGLPALVPKQFLPHKGLPLFWHSAGLFASIPRINGIIFVFPPELDKPARAAVSDICALPAAPWAAVPPPNCGSNEAEQAEQGLDAFYDGLVRHLEAGQPLGLAWNLGTGGRRRQDSVARALELLPAACSHVLVHDSARPFVSPALIERVLCGLEQGQPAVIPGIELTDTVKRVDENDLVLETPARDRMRAVQTPQGFDRAELTLAHSLARSRHWDVTDDAALMELCARPVLLVPGEEGNIKITRLVDMELLDTAPLRRKDCREEEYLPCSGLGYDVHRYQNTGDKAPARGQGARALVLGGVPIPCDIRVLAHSDGDTLLHALMDALLGCIGGGDIGAVFPDSDPALDGISSGILLSEILERTEKAGLRISTVDITIIAQVPRIAPYRENIAASLAGLLQMPRHRVNVKATTEEGLGFTGEKKGIKVLALVSGLLPAPGK
ncbi:2-C-methyl-D-erythritol 2,4-cyclodiphosphate synthase [Desulfovibrio sp. OttesenSCG-928-A18]|nr:2-C-methyl-D-erythritol 2,4-cyclodiphosphate synthase [Desulfovibrio sp. OttesenSCG-928-A18]